MFNRIFHDIDGSGLVSDIKAEVAAADLVEKGHPIDHVFIRPAGLFQRKFRKDVVEMGISDDDPYGDDLVLLQVSRDGIYDLVPQGLFHEGDRQKKDRTSADVIDEIKVNRQEEESARSFFAPFEKEFYRARVALELEERKSMLGFTDHFKYDLFLRLWPELENIGDQFLPIIFQILPIAHRAVGNTVLVSYYLSRLVDVEVTVTKHEVPIKLPNQLAHQTMGAAHLGIDSIIGSHIPDYDGYFQISLGPVQRGELTRFLPGGDIREVLDLMYQYFFPVEVDLKEDILLYKHDEELTLSTEGFDGRLGYTSRI